MAEARQARLSVHQRTPSFSACWLEFACDGTAVFAAEVVWWLEGRAWVRQQIAEHRRARGGCSCCATLAARYGSAAEMPPC